MLSKHKLILFRGLVEYLRLNLREEVLLMFYYGLNTSISESVCKGLLTIKPVLYFFVISFEKLDKLYQELAQTLLNTSLTSTSLN